NFFREAASPRLAAATTRSVPETAGMSFEAASAARFEFIYACLAGMDTCRAEAAQVRPCFLAGAETLFRGQAAATAISVPDAAATAISVPEVAATAISVPDAAVTAISCPDAAATALSVPDAAVTALSVPDAAVTALSVPDAAATALSVPDAAVTADVPLVARPAHVPLAAVSTDVPPLHGPGPPSLPRCTFHPVPLREGTVMIWAVGLPLAT
ncbi:hypothetical protein M9458_034044, partial [Cirrhinus mrigala]